MTRRGVIGVALAVAFVALATTVAVLRSGPPELPEGATDGSDEGYGAVYAPAAPETSAR